MTNILSLHINNTDLISKSSFNYLPEQETSSHSTNTKFVDGGYYKYVKVKLNI